MMTTVSTKIIEEIREIRDLEIAKMQETAKNNFPKILEMIKVLAKQGKSEMELPESQLDQFDRENLIKEGFIVTHLEIYNRDDYGMQYEYYKSLNKTRKVWVIKW